MMLPVPIQRLRINVSIKNFYQDLKTFCTTMHWKCEDPICNTKNLQTDVIDWQNNLVFFAEISHYPTNSVREIEITYKIPSFVGPEKSESEIFEDKPLPQIGTEHVLSLTLHQNYPLHIAQTNIQSISPLWHNNFTFLPRGRLHGCVLISGEIDGMAMNLFQQLLWNPEFVWVNSNRGANFTLNGPAYEYANINGKDFPYRALISIMDKSFHIS